MSAPCRERAAYIRLWPGAEPDLVCRPHAEDSRKIAAALGDPALCPLIPLPEDSEAACACTEGRVQEVHVR